MSSSRVPRATFIISSFRETEGLRSKARVSDFVDPVTLVHDDAAEELRRVFFVIDHVLWRFAGGGNILAKWGFLYSLVQLLALFEWSTSVGWC